MLSCEYCEIPMSNFLQNSIGRLPLKVTLLKRAVQLKEQVSEQSFADFHLGALKNFVNSTEKHLFWSLFLMKLQA